MNKKDREQLRESIAKDLIEGQGSSSPTRELLKLYAPMDGIVSAVTRRFKPGDWQQDPPGDSLIG
jgi:hypothetical protein